jgi:serine protease Do
MVRFRFLVPESPSIMHDDPRHNAVGQPLLRSVVVSPQQPPPIERGPEGCDVRELTLQRVDPPATRPVDRNRRRQRGPDPITQSLMFLATMGIILVASRFAVPRIVEEIRFAWHRGELRAEYELGNAGLQNVSLDTLSQAYQMVSSAVGPSVVHIDVQRRLPVELGVAQRTSQQESPHLSFTFPSSDQGSGVIIDPDGYLLTNRHVIVDGEDITVTLSDGRRVAAVVVGTDELTDLALLRINADRLLPIHWGNSDQCRVGAPVWAVGSPFGLDRTVTFGIVSGKHRKVRASTQYQDFMQSDVAVNPGNSGGPLVDARGRLVGINTAIVGDTYQGVSFSVPSNVAKQVYQHLRATGQVERGFLGVGLNEVADDQLVGDNPRVRGALINSVAVRSPAADAGLELGDLILRVDRKPVRDMGHLMRMIGDLVAGSPVDLTIQREDTSMEIRVILGSRPPTLDAG